MKLRLPGRRRGSTHEERPPTSAGSAASPSSEESPATSPAPDLTSATSGSEYADLEVTWAKDDNGQRTFEYAGVRYTVMGARAGEYWLNITSLRNARNFENDHAQLQTLDDCKARIRERLGEDIPRFG